MNPIDFPEIIPSSMDFDPPLFPIGVDRSLGGITTRRKYGNRPSDGRLRVEFRNISNAICANILSIHFASGGLAPVRFRDSFFSGSGSQLKPYLDGSAYQGLSWYFIEDSPPRISRVEGGGEISNMSIEFAARLVIS